VDLALDKIQGNIVPGFSKDYQAFVLVSFGGAEQGRGWLAAIQPDIASASELANFKAIFTSVRDRSPHPSEPDKGALGHVSATWVNVGLSFTGLRMLVGAQVASQFPAAFQRDQPPGFNRALWGGGADALIIIAADRDDDLQTELNRQRRRFSSLGVQELNTFCGGTLPGNQRGYEHFGFKDAISQPRIAGTDWGNGPEIAAGEFVLGYPDETGHRSGARLPAWTQNGGFLAFVQLQQYVDAFWRTMKDTATRFRVAPEDVASWIVGRNRAGDKIADPPARVSHIGRAYSRWLPDANRHRILRRGIPYGPPLAPDQPSDGQDRGLLFLAYQADIERQFEHVWSQWLNSRSFPAPEAGTDGLVGQVALRGGTTTKRVSSVARPDPNGGMLNLQLPNFVRPRYGAYFFSPAVDVLHKIDRMPAIPAP
jgi:Dyp-type peroxidase family